MKINKKIGGLWAVSLALVGGVTGAIAYYSGSTATVRNEVKILSGGSNNMQLVDTYAKADMDASHQPNETVTKEVKVKNNGTYPIFAALKVTVPSSACKIGGGSRVTQEVLHIGPTALNSATAASSNDSQFLTGWTVDRTAGNGVYYLYSSSPINAGSELVAFNKYTINNISEMDSAFDGNIDVKAAYVQSEGYTAGSNELKTLLKSSLDASSSQTSHAPTAGNSTTTLTSQ